MTDRAQDTEAIRAALVEGASDWLEADQALDRLVARLEAAERKIADADSYLADPAGNPIDAINLARAALALAAPGETTLAEPECAARKLDRLSGSASAAPGEAEQTP